MIVRSGAKPNGKLIEVELNEDDCREFWDEPISLAEKWQIMTKKADILLIEYMLRNGDISQNFAEQRIKEIQNG